MDVTTPGVKTSHKHGRSGGKTNQSGFVLVCWLYSASQPGFLVHHADCQAGNPDALLFVLMLVVVAAGNAVAGRHC